MAADSRDPITGAYIFSDTGAPDIGVDPTLVSAQANDVGTRIIRASLAELEAYEYKRKGLRGHALDTGTEFLYDGSGWAVLNRPFGAYTTTVTGLTLAQVAVDAKYEQRGKLIRGEVTITRGTAGSPTGTVQLSLPTTPANASALRNLGSGSMYLQNNLLVYVAHARYTGGSVVQVNLPTMTGSALTQGSNVNATNPTSAAHDVGTTIHIPFEYETA